MVTIDPELETPLYEGEEINVERMSIDEMRLTDMAAEASDYVASGEVVDVEALKTELNALTTHEEREMKGVWVQCEALCDANSTPLALSDLDQRGQEIVRWLVDAAKTKSNEAFSVKFFSLPAPFQVELVSWAHADPAIKNNENASLLTVRKGITTHIRLDSLEAIACLYEDFLGVQDEMIEIVKALDGDRSAFHGAMAAAYNLYGGNERKGMNGWAVHNLAAAIELGIMPVGNGSESTPAFDWSKFASDNGYASQKAMRDAVAHYAVWVEGEPVGDGVTDDTAALKASLNWRLSLKKMPPALLKEFIGVDPSKVAVILADSIEVGESESSTRMPDSDSPDQPLEVVELTIINNPDLEDTPTLSNAQIAEELDRGFRNLMTQAGRFGDELYRLQQLARSIDPSNNTHNTNKEQ